jgi:two-component system chemotaxis response regulator CheY
MRSLIVDDDLISRRVGVELLRPYGVCDQAASGREALQLFVTALEEQKPYNLVLLDIQMPGLDGQETLAALRAIETQRGIAPQMSVKIMMTTVNLDHTSIITAFKNQCAAYLVKPLTRESLTINLEKFGLVPWNRNKIGSES